MGWIPNASDVKTISKDVVKMKHPLTLDELRKMNDEELQVFSLKKGILRAQIDGINDIDTRRTFMIQENLRLNPPCPKGTNPVLVSTDYDWSPSGEKTQTFRKVTHKFDDKAGTSYNHSEVEMVQYKVKYQKSDLDNHNKRLLIQEIQNEISKLKLDEYKTLDAIMKFACDNSKSNGEKRKRAVALQKKLQEKEAEHKQKQKQKQQKQKYQKTYERHRITTHDIAVY